MLGVVFFRPVHQNGIIGTRQQRAFRIEDAGTRTPCANVDGNDEVTHGRPAGLRHDDDTEFAAKPPLPAASPPQGGESWGGRLVTSPASFNQRFFPNLLSAGARPSLPLVGSAAQRGS